MRLKERLFKFIDHVGVEKSVFERNSNLSNGFVDKLGDNPRRNSLDRISKAYPELNMEWLIVGDGEMLNNTDDEVKQKSQPQYENIQYGIPKPFIDTAYASCGIPNGFSIAVKASDCESIIIPFLSDYDFSIRARGDSMINRENPQRSIRERDIIACKLWTSRSHIRWGEVYALSTSEGVVVKKIMHSDLDGHIKCVSFNTEDGFDSYDLPLEEVFDWALVVGVVSINTW